MPCPQRCANNRSWTLYFPKPSDSKNHLGCVVNPQLPRPLPREWKSGALEWSPEIYIFKKCSQVILCIRKVWGEHWQMTFLVPLGPEISDSELPTPVPPLPHLEGTAVELHPENKNDLKALEGGKEVRGRGGSQPTVVLAETPSWPPWAPQSHPEKLSIGVGGVS